MPSYIPFIEILPETTEKLHQGIVHCIWRAKVFNNDDVEQPEKHNQELREPPGIKGNFIGFIKHMPIRIGGARMGGTPEKVYHFP